MPSLLMLSRITLIVGIVLVLGLMLWLVDSCTRSIVIFFTPVANLMLLLLIVLLVVLIGAVVYYVLMIQGAEKSRRQRQSATAPSPRAKTEAAEETLRAVRQQMEQIQDEVSRQALLSRSREIEANLARGELQVWSLARDQLAKALW